MFGAVASVGTDFAYTRSDGSSHRLANPFRGVSSGGFPYRQAGDCDGTSWLRTVFLRSST